MKAIAKTRTAPGIELIDADEPALLPGTVKLKVEYGSVCGTDLHIYKWDPWAAHRIHPPRIIGHEFCGVVTEIGEGVTTHKPGDFVASESHIVCGCCKQCLHGQGHVCVNTQILGVDVDGGFRPVTVVPAANARHTSPSISKQVACVQDPLGNAVHTAMAGPIEGRTILITGMGPIGLFAVAICKALGAEKVYGVEISPYRVQLAETLGIDAIWNPTKVNVSCELSKVEPLGVDATLEMSGHPSALDLAIEHTRPGGRISLLGVFPDRLAGFDFNGILFKGIDVQGIVGRRIWETWDNMKWLLETKKLDITPVITHDMPYTEFDQAMNMLTQGAAGKIVFNFQP